MSFEFIQISAKGQGVANDALTTLLSSGCIASVRKEFVSNSEDSFRTFCVGYLDGVFEEKGRPVALKIEYKEDLSKPDLVLFCTLLDWRKALAERETVPTDLIFTNEQFSAKVKEQVDKLMALGEFADVGAVRVDNCGTAFVALLPRKGGAA